ncbi:hypothetical protein PENANT_c066G10863 [Penicillium antarcticum]|uniref:Uncharacterized protein n=2 Tax=Penicillium antarcticum TaxID=416450 RepID=A0A1V6PPT6_9EURO|nr:hypothetical protein PENANT_c066G10863 [Penicillium antarcticum]
MPQPTITELHKPRLTPIKPERTLMISKADHEEPAHKHNDITLNGEIPNVISRTHTSHSPSYVAHRSLEYLPLSAQNVSVNEEISAHVAGIFCTQSAPGVSFENDFIQKASGQPLDQSNNPNSPPNLDPFPILSTGSLSQTENLPFRGQLNGQFDNQLDRHLVASQKFDAPLLPAIRSAPWMDWPIFNVSCPKTYSTSYSQNPSYASFDDPYFGFPDLTPLSDDIPEVEKFLPFLTVDAASHSDAYGSASRSDESESDLNQITPFSDGDTTHALPLAPSNPKSIDIDEILKLAETDANAFQRQL